MVFIDFINDDIPVVFKDFHLKYLSTGYKAISLRLLEGTYNTEYALIDTKTYNEVYDAIFISTADGTDLDKLGLELGFVRLGGESDTDYRNRLIAIYNIIQKGSTIESISEFIESLGYVIDYWEKLYYNNFSFDETGDNEDSYLSNDSGPGWDGWINYTIYFFLTPTPSQNDMEYLEELLQDMKKYYNKVFIR